MSNPKGSVNLPCKSRAKGYADSWAGRGRRRCYHEPRCPVDGYDRGLAEGLADRIRADGHLLNRTPQRAAPGHGPSAPGPRLPDDPSRKWNRGLVRRYHNA